MGRGQQKKSPGAEDEQYGLLSICAILVFAYLTWRYGSEGQEGDLPEDI
jgi:hypothetical protein